MAELSRITLDGIDDLVDESKILKVGRGSVKGYVWTNNCLRIETPKETRKIETPMSVWSLNKDKFLEYVNGLLKNDGLYLANVDYRVKNVLVFTPFKLSGMFYKERKDEALEEKIKGHEIMVVREFKDYEGNVRPLGERARLSTGQDHGIYTPEEVGVDYENSNGVGTPIRCIQIIEDGKKLLPMEESEAIICSSYK